MTLFVSEYCHCSKNFPYLAVVGEKRAQEPYPKMFIYSLRVHVSANTIEADSSKCLRIVFDR